jgi:hypothetical protein
VAETTSQQRSQMRKELRDMLHDGPTHVNREDIENIGSRVDLSPEEAAKLFQNLKGVAWRGDYITSDERGWIGAWIEDVY